MPLVLFASYSGALGGAERVLIDFASALGGDLRLACPGGSLASEGLRSGIGVFGLPVRRLDVRTTTADRMMAFPRLLAHGLELERLVSQLRPDLLVLWGMRSAIACGFAGLPECPVLFAHHDLLPGPMVASLVRRAASRSDRVVVASQTVAADLDPTGGLGSKLVVVYPGVDTGLFAPRGPDRDAPASRSEVLVLGAMSRMKRPDLALEAFAFARQKRADLRLRFVGEPVAEDGERLAARLRERASLADLDGSVEFVGAVDDPREEIARAGVLLHCADREPFGLAVAEALASGRPVVVPAAAGTAEIVSESCGVVFPPGNAAAAADGVLAVLDDPARAARMGAAGRERVRAQFDRGTARQQFVEVAGELLGP
jgi:glycosyltransferase involved in cell wall biosynthesis